MKKIITLLSAIFIATASFALTADEQKEVMMHLEAARAEIQSVQNAIPGYLRDKLGQSLENAQARVAYAQSIVNDSSVVANYYCVVDSTFDGAFSGRATTKLEASKLALEACKESSRSNGFFCKEKTLNCERE
jgi:hypothetical protein